MGGNTKGADRSGKARDVSTATERPGRERSEERNDRTDRSGRGLSKVVELETGSQ
jgi:hypothetical protein